ncbi:MAG: TrkH family potassium uptake protein [Synechococcales bacterium]|nr:TrkH family potassium uptake protein [Synechococcales bacterium]
MNQGNKVPLRAVGLLMQIPGGMALLSLPVCWFFGENYATLPFLLTAGVAIAPGQFLYHRFRLEKAARFRQALLIVALSWLLLFLLGTIPFVLIAHHLANQPQASATMLEFRSLWNAMFEAVSGFTTTGLSMAVDASQLPHCLQWWRSLMQWVGGIGLIVLTLSILEPSNNVAQLYSAEARDERLAPTLQETAQRIWLIYLFYTGISILLLAIAGMPPWAAINHGLAGISTGGFAITGASLKVYGPTVQAVTIPIMILGSISFLIHARLLRQREISVLWTDTRHRALWILLIAGSLFLVFERAWFSGSWEWLVSAFHWTSAITTCGFAVVDEQGWSPLSKMLMILAMVCGAVSGGTGGGLKLDRIVVLYESVVWNLKLVYRESPEDLRYELNGQILSEKEAHRHLKTASVLAMLWFASLTVGTLILFHAAAAEFSLVDTLFESASALGNVGLSTGITTPELFWTGKVVLMLLMWMGRLEIIAVFVFFSWLLRSGKNMVLSGVQQTR